MIKIFAAIILASLFFPAGQSLPDSTGFNFFTQKAVDISFLEKSQDEKIVRQANDSLGIETSAKSIMVVDQESSRVLYDKNSRQVLPIASLTKLMSAVIFLEHNPGWDKKVVIEKNDNRNGGIVYLLPDDEVTVRDLFNLMLVASSNEAATALVKATGLDNFVALMNQKAFELGMRDIFFIEPTGLEPGNRSSAADLIKLAQTAFGKEEIINATRQEVYSFEIANSKRKVKAFSTDQLLQSFLNNKTFEVMGAKTGYLDEAGYCLIVEIRKAGGKPLILSILGSSSQNDRWQEAKGVIDWVYGNYKWQDG